MKTTILILLGLGVILSACGDKRTPEQRAQMKANIEKNDTIWGSRSKYVHNGITYEIGIAPDKKYALVAPLNQTHFKITQIEAAVSAYTGCKAQDESILSVLNGSKDAGISVTILEKTRGRFRVELTC